MLNSWHTYIRSCLHIIQPQCLIALICAWAPTRAAKVGSTSKYWLNPLSPLTPSHPQALHPKTRLNPDTHCVGAPMLLHNPTSTARLVKVGSVLNSWLQANVSVMYSRLAYETYT